VLADGLARHVQAPAEIPQRLSIFSAQAIEQFPSARIGQRPEHLIHE
jgi:hypothetical protein